MESTEEFSRKTFLAAQRKDGDEIERLAQTRCEEWMNFFAESASISEIDLPCYLAALTFHKASLESHFPEEAAIAKAMVEGMSVITTVAKRTETKKEE